MGKKARRLFRIPDIQTIVIAENRSVWKTFVVQVWPKNGEWPGVLLVSYYRRRGQEKKIQEIIKETAVRVHLVQD